MPLLSRRIPYDRKRLLERADALRIGWRWRAAIPLYRQILSAEPNGVEIHDRLAPLLARAGQRVEAWESFQRAAEALAGTNERAALVGLHRRAVKAMPRCFEAWRGLARAELRSEGAERALQTLQDGARRLARWRRTRDHAILLLRDARALDPRRPSVAIELARQLRRAGRPAEALFLLDDLDPRVDGETLRDVRRLTFRIEPSLRHAWRLGRAMREVRSASNGAKARTGSSERRIAPGGVRRASAR